ncbi:DHA2 family metal-tetracycline-proton antiporter-like MFS transporter [Salsuginibacillus halophilus]|uniref:DHA2 family metal-tetracycline-proton antiporter-like MFS transporter n=1 Tax=Salsuginibacillus halophilus TaxID=517424 RepID=A0A2P8H3M9_9BACI|nr:MFS transporter [Salsuginibacillus halophilus]PSL40822.1 DHA2 family metal-tetracycline-proton antiporter-like MFS transporter [Salsuginibacillus halophilus]
MSTSTSTLPQNNELNEQSRKQLIRLLALILIFAVMNGTMFNVAIPDISETFGLMPSQVSWVMTGYVMVYAIASVMYGKLADMYPIRNLLTIGIALFAAGSLLGFFAPNYTTLLAARVLQAMGGATIPALSFIIPARFFPSEKGKVFGIIASTVAFASGVGPIAGGMIGGVLEWRYLFLFPAVSVLAIPFFRKWIPHEETRGGRLDIFGGLLTASVVASLLSYVTTLNPWFLILFAVSVPLFIWRMKTAEDPFINPAILADASFRTTVLTSFLGTSAMFGLIFVIPIMLRELYDMSTLGIGLMLFPGAMLAGIFGRYGGRLVDEKGSRFVVRLAFILITAGVFFISTFAGALPVVLALAIVVAYLGFPLVQSSTAGLLSSILPAEKNGVGFGLFNLFNFISGAFSSAIFGAVLDWQSVTYTLNPVAAHGDHAIFSNVFFSLGIVALIALFIFSRTFRSQETDPSFTKHEPAQREAAAEAR